MSFTNATNLLCLNINATGLGVMDVTVAMIVRNFP
jgi:hypothetical protein